MNNTQEIFTFIDKLAERMQRHKLSSIETSIGDMRIRLDSTHNTHSHPPSYQAPTTTESIETNGTSVLSPTVGTFYAKASPTDKSFVTLNTHVQKGQTLGLIESMKVFHPLLAPCNGTITHIHIEHAQSTEYHQCLMTIKPDTA